MANLPSKLDLKKLPIDELVTLHSNVSEVLQARAQSESNDLEEKLQRLQPFLGGKTKAPAKAKAAPVAKKGKKRGRPKKLKAKIQKAAVSAETAPAAAPVAEVVASKPVSKRRGRPKGSVNKKPIVAKEVAKKIIKKSDKVEKVDKRKGPRKSATTTQYVDPATKAVWAGRGRTPKWLVEYEQKGRKRSEFLKK